MLYRFQLSDPWFDLVKIGRKKYEGKKIWEKTDNIKLETKSSLLVLTTLKRCHSKRKLLASTDI